MGVGVDGTGVGVDVMGVRVDGTGVGVDGWVCDVYEKSNKHVGMDSRIQASQTQISQETRGGQFTSRGVQFIPSGGIGTHRKWSCPNRPHSRCQPCFVHFQVYQGVDKGDGYQL
eukprot:784761-Pyramimonas_sp.AAC.1